MAAGHIARPKNLDSQILANRSIEILRPLRAGSG